MTITRLKTKYIKGRVPSVGSRGKRAILPFAAPTGHPYSVAVAYPFIFKSSVWYPPISPILTLWLTYKDLCDYTVPAWIIQKDLPSA